MRISDWSSDVCSSDLPDVLAVHAQEQQRSDERSALVAVDKRMQVRDAMRIGRCQCGQVGGRVAVAVQLQRLCQCRSEQPAVANTLHAAVLGKLAGVDGFDDPVMQPDWFGAHYLANCRKTSRFSRITVSAARICRSNSAS